MAQKLLLFWRKPARRCWWEGVELENVDGIEGKLKVWIRRVWTLEMVSTVSCIIYEPYGKAVNADKRRFSRASLAYDDRTHLYHWSITRSVSHCAINTLLARTHERSIHIVIFEEAWSLYTHLFHRHGSHSISIYSKNIVHRLPCASALFTRLYLVC